LTVDPVDEAVAAAGAGRVLARERPGTGRRNDVWLVESSGAGAVVVRFLADGGRREMEVALLARAGAAGVPVAEVLWTTAAPRPVIVQRRLPGRLLVDVEVSDGLCRSVAETLRVIHGIPLEGGFGNLGPDLRGEDARLSTWFTGRVEEEAAATTRSTMPSDDRAMVDDVVGLFVASETLLDSLPAGLVHGDLQPSNLLVEGDRVSGVLDWEAAKAGPPALDFGWWDWFSTAFSTPWSTDQLLAHYDPVGRIDRAELGVVRRLVGCRVWVRELLAAHRSGDEARAGAARRGLLAAGEVGASQRRAGG
jgi:aminoglycoside phosphotransferase (APT) family kinase protein